MSEAGNRAQEFAHNIVKQADLSPSRNAGLLRNGLANRIAWVHERNPATGVPSRVTSGRPSPLAMVPVRYGRGPGAPETIGLPTLATHVERADPSAAYPALSLSEAKRVHDLSTAIIQLERSVDGLMIARSGPLSRLVRVVGNTPCVGLYDAANDPWHVSVERGPGDFFERPQTDIETWCYEVTGSGAGGGPVETPIAPQPGTPTVTTPAAGSGRVESGFGAPTAADADFGT